MIMDKEILKRGLFQFNCEVTELQEKRLEIYSEMLVEWNKKINLTAVTDPAGISVKHFLDSIIPVIEIPMSKGAEAADVGTGAGFPGMPVKIMRDDLKFTFIDSLNKRINFLKEVSERLEINDNKFLHSRAEDAGRAKEYRGKFDYTVSRAVAPLRILGEYCIPLLKMGGIFMAYKSYDIDDEINEAKSIIGNIGGKIGDIKEIKIPDTDIVRKIVLIEKVRETPEQFPRRSNKIK